MVLKNSPMNGGGIQAFVRGGGRYQSAAKQNVKCNNCLSCGSEVQIKFYKKRS